MPVEDKSCNEICIMVQREGYRLKRFNYSNMFFEIILYVKVMNKAS